MDKSLLKTMRVAVLLGGRSSERDVSLKSGEAVLASLKRSGYDAIAIDAQDNLVENLIKGRIQVVFIALHGRWGEDGTVQGLLEMMDIPYTGSGVRGSSMAMDKAVMKLVCAAHGIPTPAYLIASDGKDITLPLPFVVKPANEGSTIGISVVNTKKELAPALKKALRFDRKLVIEEFVKGQEITVAVVNGQALTVVEVRPHGGFYDFESKYKKGMTDYIVPAQIGDDITARAQQIALDVYRKFDLAGSARIDMLVRDKTPLVIDINTSPGMTETSLVPKAWVHLGKTFDELVEEILGGASLKI